MAAKKIQWGFDLSGFDTRKQLDAFMKKHKCKVSGYHVRTVKGKPGRPFGDYEQKTEYTFWKCPGFKFTTSHDGTGRTHAPGYLGYVGAEIDPSALPKWMKFRNEFLDKASVKDESKRRNDFISPPSEMSKQKISWI